jgi:hypothetical protein
MSGKDIDKNDRGLFEGYCQQSLGGTGKNNQVPDSWNPAFRYETGVLMSHTRHVIYNYGYRCIRKSNIFCAFNVSLSVFVLSLICLTAALIHVCFVCFDVEILSVPEPQ